MKPTYSFKEMCFLIWNADRAGDFTIIQSVIQSDLKKYSLTELYIFNALIKFRVEMITK